MTRPERAGFYDTIRPTDVFICQFPGSGGELLAELVAASLGKPDSDAPPASSFRQLVPDLSREHAEKRSLGRYQGFTDPRFFRIDAPYDACLPKAVYVVRNPRELSHDGPADWNDHVRSWLKPLFDPRILLVRYEQMQLNPKGVIRDVVRFAGLSLSPEQIENALNRLRKTSLEPALRPVPNSRLEPIVIERRFGATMRDLGYEI